MQGYGGPPPQAGFGGPPPQGPPGGGGGGDGQFMYEGKFVRGTINWFDANKNFGFLRTEFGGEDMFLHGNDLSPAVFPIVAGDAVVFQVVMHRGKPKAVNMSKDGGGGGGGGPPPGPPGGFGPPPGQGGGFGGPPGPGFGR